MTFLSSFNVVSIQSKPMGSNVLLHKKSLQNVLLCVCFPALLGLLKALVPSLLMATGRVTQSGKSKVAQLSYT